MGLALPTPAHALSRAGSGVGLRKNWDENTKSNLALIRFGEICEELMSLLIHLLKIKTQYKEQNENNKLERSCRLVMNSKIALPTLKQF